MVELEGFVEVVVVAHGVFEKSCERLPLVAGAGYGSEEVGVGAHRDAYTAFGCAFVRPLAG